MKIQLVTDSSANLTGGLKNPLAVAPLRIITEEREYADTPVLNVDVMLRDLKEYKGRSGTSCPSAGDWLASFGEADIIMGVTLTSALSGGYNSACIAAREYMETHPKAKVFIQDSLSTGPEMLLLLEKMDELLSLGVDFGSVVDAMHSYHKRTHLVFSLACLNNFSRNGRVSPVLAKALGILNFRIVGRAGEDGTLEPIHKCRGDKKALELLQEVMEESGYCGGKVRIHHTACGELAEGLAKTLRQTYPGADIAVARNRGVCSFYVESGGFLLAYETPEEV